MSLPGFTRPLLHGLALGLIALYGIAFFAGNVSLQWDLKSYLAAASAALAGHDPYDPAQVAAVAGRAIAFPFIYPPIALIPFMVLVALPAAPVLWLALKLVLLGGLIALWRSAFMPGMALLPLVTITLFGWNAAALWDLRAGNVATLETALLWGAFASFVAGRRGAFATIVVAAACFKLLPASFLFLLLVPVGDRRAEPGRFAIALLALVAIVAAPLWVGPAAGWRWSPALVPAAMVAGEANPGAASAFATLATMTGRDQAEAARLGWIGYAIYAALLLVVSRPHLIRTWRARRAADWVMSAVMLYVLLSPRPMAYGFMLLAPVPLYFAPRPFDGRSGPILLALIFSAQGFMRVAQMPPVSFVGVYSPLFLTLALWLLIVTRSAPESGTSPGLAPRI